jgi:hypothetical protein
MTTQLELARAAVAAKAAYWDALRELELATIASDEDTWTDDIDTAVLQAIESAAEGVDDPSAVPSALAQYVLDVALGKSKQ